MKFRFSLFILLILLVTSCKKENPQQYADKLVFGTHYGFCQGNCFTAFGIDNEKVQRDTGVHYLYNYQDYTFTGSVTLHDSLYLQVNHLLSEIPVELTTLQDTVFGCPDCHDQGGIYIEINTDGVSRRFNIDNDSTGDQSAELLEFKTRIRTAIGLLN